MKTFLLICFCCFFQQHVISQSNQVIRSTTSASGATDIVVQGDKTYIIQQSVGQPSAIGMYNNENYILRQGFIQPNVLAKIKEKDVPLDLLLTIYPNPFNEQISLAFKEDVESIINVVVFDLLGRQVFAKNYQSGQHINVRLDKLSSGEYILKAIANQKQFITKILKK